MILVHVPIAAKDHALTASLHSGRILLIRHGQTAWNVERRFLGRTDIPLDATGEAQAARLGERMAGIRLDALWSSPLARARQTAAPLGAPAIEPGFIEMDMGELEGLAGVEFAARYPALVAAWRDTPHDVRLPGGEDLVDVQARGLAAFTRVVRTVGPGQVVAVVTHQLVLATVVCHLAGEPLARFRTFMHRNTGITTVDLGDTPRLGRVDDADHLSG
jgi:probable phosphoglycerate mutase